MDEQYRSWHRGQVYLDSFWLHTAHCLSASGTLSRVIVVLSVSAGSAANPGMRIIYCC